MAPLPIRTLSITTTQFLLHFAHQGLDRLAPVVAGHVRMDLTPQRPFDPVVVRAIRRQEVQADPNCAN